MIKTPEEALRQLRGEHHAAAPVRPKALPAVSAIPDPTAVSKPKARALHAVQRKPESELGLYSVAELMAQAGRYIYKLEYEKAIDCYRKVLEREPIRPDLYDQIADCHERIGETDQATSMRDIARDLRETSGVAALAAASGGSSSASASRPLLLQDPIASSVDVWRSAKSSTKSIKKRLEEARILSNDNRFAKAEKAYRDLRDDVPGDSEVLLGLGWCLHKQKKHVEAAREFERSLELSSNPLAYQGLIQCKIYLREFDTALDLACQCLDDFPWSKTIIDIKRKLEQQMGIARPILAASAPNPGIGVSCVSVSAPRPALTFGAFLPPEVLVEKSATLRPGSAWSAVVAKPGFVAEFATSMVAPPPGFAPQRLVSPWVTAAATKPQFCLPANPVVPALPARVAAVRKVTREEIEHARRMSYDDRRPDLAEIEYRKLLAREASNSEVLLGLGWCLQLLRRNEEAVPYFENSLEQRASAQAYHGLARSYRYSDDPINALRVASEGLNVFKGDKKLKALQKELGEIMLAGPTALAFKGARHPSDAAAYYGFGGGK